MLTLGISIQILVATVRSFSDVLYMNLLSQNPSKAFGMERKKFKHLQKKICSLILILLDRKYAYFFTLHEENGMNISNGMRLQDGHVTVANNVTFDSYVYDERSTGNSSFNHLYINS